MIASSRVGRRRLGLAKSGGGRIGSYSRIYHRKTLWESLPRGEAARRVASVAAGIRRRWVEKGTLGRHTFAFLVLSRWTRVCQSERHAPATRGDLDVDLVCSRLTRLRWGSCDRYELEQVRVTRFFVCVCVGGGRGGSHFLPAFWHGSG